MLASFLIIGFSLILLVYWFRYSCILLLRNISEQTPVSTPGISDGRFSFAAVQRQLNSGADLPDLQRSLDRDYQVIRYLLEHGAGLELQSIEDRLLVLDYRVMRLYYRMTKTAVPDQARNALSEMAAVLGVLVQKIGAQAGLQHEA
jgi:hypothetical protein